MRVATAFTGAVAFAAAFTPSAVADTRASRLVAEPAAAGLQKNCTGATWDHVATSTGGAAPTSKTICFERAPGPIVSSTFTIPGVGNYFAACGGSTSGYYSGISHSGHGAHFKDTFKPGKTYWAFPHNGPIENFTVHFTLPVYTTDKC
jgi:hypothetical protein